MKKSKFYNLLGILPLFIFFIIWLVYLIIIQAKATLLFTGLTILIGVSFYKFIVYCSEKEFEAKKQEGEIESYYNTEETPKVNSQLPDLSTREKGEQEKPENISSEVSAYESNSPVDTDKKKKVKCLMSKEGKCTSDYSPLKCNGIDIPDDCTYAIKKEEENK